ncbi:LamG-like jellyroll fold domain-containing protein [Streptomyces sp. NBC_00096]|uniref:LamG-like jellyroll fold domain-containing protein n=1 Tax=Streptomyces sp. NBC_00096 TaxID=2975650 RepID=UPI0032457F84
MSLSAVLPTALGGGLAAAAAAAPVPPVPITADELPTWQPNGIVWAMTQADGVVFAGGTFSTVRPPGAAAGDSETPAVNFVALDAATGQPTSCALSFTVGSGLATVRALAVSPDHKTLYAGGRFGAVNGVATSNLAAIDIATCKPKANFQPSVNATVRALTVTKDEVYLGGDFTSVAGQPRRYFASVTTASAALRSWTANTDKTGRAIEVTPDGQNVILGGDFFTVNGRDSQALAVVSSTSGTLTKAYPAGFLASNVRVKDISIDSTGFYTAMENLSLPTRPNDPIAYDGRMAFDLGSFNERWRDTCFGATQAVEAYKGVLYSASHVHDCRGLDEFTERWERQHLLAQPVGSPGPILGWFPDTNDGLGEGIGPRVLAVAPKNDTDYMWVGGEFTKVNGKPQQGLTRFSGAKDTGSPSVPQASVSSTTPGKIDVRWQSSIDLDNSDLTYRVYRNGSSTPVYTVTGSSSPWNRPQLTFSDTNVTPGTTYTYRITASDGTNTSALSAPAKVKPAAAADPYAARVVADGAKQYWRFDETAGTFAADASGNGNSGIHKGGVKPGVTTPNGVNGFNAAAGYLGTDQHTYSEHPSQTPAAYTIETWFRTTTKSGGKLIGFDSNNFMLGRTTDKNLFMSNDGYVWFGVRSGTNRTIHSVGALNNGKWHHVVAAQSPIFGMSLYVDGVLEAANRQVTTSADYLGYWIVGGGVPDALAGWQVGPGNPSSASFTGEIDETAVYPTALTPRQVTDHYVLSGRTASQSSTYSGASATRAVDGDTNGDWFAGSVSHTALEASPWWQTDLGASRTLQAIEIHNRTDCCSERLTDYWVFVSDTPFTPGLTPAQQAARTGVWSSHQTTPAGASVTIPVSRTGRYVMIQLNGTGYLSLAEVKPLTS